MYRGIWPMPLSLLNHSAPALFAQRTRIPTSARSIGFCAIWVCISSSSSSKNQQPATTNNQQHTSKSPARHRHASSQRPPLKYLNTSTTTAHSPCLMGAGSEVGWEYLGQGPMLVLELEIGVGSEHQGPRGSFNRQKRHEHMRQFPLIYIAWSRYLRSLLRD